MGVFFCFLCGVNMGNSASDFENAQPIQLDAGSALDVFGRSYCSDHPRDLCMKEKSFSFSGDDFYINDNETNNPVFKIKGKTMSLSDKKTLYDVHGSKIGMIKEKHLTLHRRMYIVDNNDMVRVIVRKSSYFQLAAAADAWILKKPLPLDKVNKDETKSRPADINMGGNWRAKNFVFVKQGQVIGKTQRKGLTMRGVLAGKDTYFIHVPSFVDAALLTLLAVCLDEVFRDDQA